MPSQPQISRGSTRGRGLRKPALFDGSSASKKRSLRGSIGGEPPMKRPKYAAICFPNKSISTGKMGIKLSPSMREENVPPSSNYREMDTHDTETSTSIFPLPHLSPTTPVPIADGMFRRFSHSLPHQQKKERKEERSGQHESHKTKDEIGRKLKFVNFT